ncbi:MAG: hypothetical protein ACREQP_01450, partial [Candidatus Binatia bacterium]
MSPKLLTSAIAAFCLAACAVPVHRASPDLSQRVPTIKTVLLVSPKVKVFELRAGGAREKIDDWSEQAAKNVSQAIAENLAARTSFRMARSSEDSLPEEEKAKRREFFALYEAVDNAIILHTYGPPEQRFEEKLTNFDYSLGPEVRQLRTE